MLVRRGNELALPRPEEMMPLPESSDLFLLPDRKALGLDPETGRVEVMDGLALAGFASPGHTLCATAAFAREEAAPRLPLYAYGAVGYFRDRFWISAMQVDKDQRQNFSGFDDKTITRKARELLARYPRNRLISHLAGCALNYCCPAARNLALGRFEAPLPTARECNAACIGCISYQPGDSGIQATQARIDFTPSPAEIKEVMLEHCRKEKRPILSFGQGCEGEPLTRARKIIQVVQQVRQAVPAATINMNTNASLPEFIAPLARAGMDSIRVSLNSAEPEFYSSYYRPRGYSFQDVVSSISEARKHSMFISLNLLYFPGISDTESQLELLTGLVQDHRIDFIQMRNMNLDPDIYLELAGDRAMGPGMGLKNFLSRLKKECPWINFGYFNPYVDRD